VTAGADDEAVRLAADAMWKHDGASRHLGMELLSVAPGRASVALTIGQQHTNGFGIAHGGVVFALADTAFAFACNYDGRTTVGAHCSISFLRPAHIGDRLVAVAREVHRARRSGLYDVRIMSGETAVAEFRGHSRTLGG
jgi:acyl-CoA thioesterase